MLRSLISRVVALGMLSPALVVAATGSDIASAAPENVLTVEWNTKLASGTLAGAADVVAYSPASTTAPSGVGMSVAGSAKKVTVAPPKSTLFTAGTTYPATKSVTANAAMLSISGVYSTTLCPESTATSTTASITVREAQYDGNGVLTVLAADYRAVCTFSSNGAQEMVSGSIRYGSARPWMALRQSYAKDVVAFGHQRTADVTMSAVGAGKSVTLGAASISGARARDYRVAANDCVDAVLGDGDTCSIQVTFEPKDDDPNGPRERVATLAIDTTGHVTDPVRVRLNSTATQLPGEPETLTTYPTANGIGVTWDEGWPSAAGYRLVRRLPGEETWTQLADFPNGGPYNYVDRDPAPGVAVDYRVTGYNADWNGPSSTTSTTRASSVPTPGPDTVFAFASAAASGGHATITDAADGATVTAFGGQRPGITATGGRAGDAMAPPQATFYVPFVPGPGEYRSSAGLSGWLSTSTAPNLTCTYVDSVLNVRSVAYAEDRKPLVFHADWAGRCANGIVTRIQIRLGVSSGHSRLTTDPVVVGRLTTYGGRSQPGAVTVTNHGPETVKLRGATVRADAAVDWTVTENACEGVTLAVGDSCVVALRFSSTGDRARPAVLEVEQHDSTGPRAPVFVPLDGWGATPPAAPYGFASTAIGALLVWSHEGPDDGGLPIQSYDVQRRPHGQTVWTTVATVPGGPKLSYVDQDVVDGATYDYRARAANEVGPGPWGRFGGDAVETAFRAIVVSGSTQKTGPRGLFLLSPDSWQAPYVSLTDDSAHDYRDPAASPAGSRLAVSVGAGDSTDGEYDLWAGTLDNPKSRQLTSMPGAERDAVYSPDASSIAFTHLSADGSRSVWTIPALGGEPQRIRDAAAAPAWTADGTGLVVEDDSAADAPLLRIHLGDKTTEVVPGTAGASDPAVSRVGAIAYVDTTGRVLELAPGATTPTVKLNQVVRRYSDTAYDDTGKLYASSERTDTGTPDALNSRLPASGEPTPVRQDRQAPWVTPAGMTDFVRGEAAFTPQYGDNGETPQVALQPQCQLDGGPWEICTGPMTYPGLAEGAHLLKLRLSDEASHTTSQTVRFVSDTVAPTLEVRGPRNGVVLDSRATFNWEGVDQASGSDWYDIEVRTATPTSDFSGYRLPRGWSTPEQTNTVVQRIAIGEELCLRGRVRDQSGLWSPYVQSCVGRPVDDSSLVASAGWRRRVISGRYQNTETTAGRAGATLRTGAVTVKRIGVLAATCSTCGAVKAYVGKQYVGTVSLRSDRTHHLRLLTLPILARAVTGRVKLQTTSGRTVRIDGLLLRRS